MLKNILKLDGAQELKKNEQKSISGGGVVVSQQCSSDLDCPPDSYCTHGQCQVVAK